MEAISLKTLTHNCVATNINWIRLVLATPCGSLVVGAPSSFVVGNAVLQSQLNMSHLLPIGYGVLCCTVCRQPWLPQIFPEAFHAEIDGSVARYFERPAVMCVWCCWVRYLNSEREKNALVAFNKPLWYLARPRQENLNDDCSDLMVASIK